MFFLTDGNPAEVIKLKQTPKKLIYEYYYMKRVQTLNQLYDKIGHAEKMEEIRRQPQR